jgi:hypothetical protein
MFLARRKLNLSTSAVMDETSVASKVCHSVCLMATTDRRRARPATSFVLQSEMATLGIW